MSAPAWFFRMSATQHYNMHPVVHVFIRKLAIGQMRVDVYAGSSYSEGITQEIENRLRSCSWLYTASLQREVETLRATSQKHDVNFSEFSWVSIEVALGFV